ncbi:hypothetical protein [Dactylosporangium darangshiense]|uniref:hypothetical protein n=1 Tax=Dactylosporangium darangshiense TaxID=579108 RepID=UPI00362E4FE3
MIYQHPLAYLLGIEGLALLHAWGGEYDEKFTQRRLAEVRDLLANPALTGHEGYWPGGATRSPGTGSGRRPTTSRATACSISTSRSCTGVSRRCRSATPSTRRAVREGTPSTLPGEGSR